MKRLYWAINKPWQALPILLRAIRVSHARRQQTDDEHVAWARSLLGQGQIADLSEYGTDTKRVEELRKILADHYKQRERINQNYSDILRLVEDDQSQYNEELANQLSAQARLRRITINRFSTVLSEEWRP